MSTAADRARAERLSQGLPTPAEATGVADVDARVAAAYRTTATVLASAAPDRSSVVRRDAVERPGTGAAGSTRSADHAPAHAARAGQPSGSSAPARSKTKKKAGTAVTAPARDASTPAKGVQETA